MGLEKVYSLVMRRIPAIPLIPLELDFSIAYRNGGCWAHHKSLLTNRLCHHLAVRHCGDACMVGDALGLIRILGHWILKQKIILEEVRATSEYMAHTIGNNGFW